MRSTRASAAVERLKIRSGNPLYALVRRSDGLIVLHLARPGAPTVAVGGPLALDDFVVFVDAQELPRPKPVSKLDATFRQQLKRK